MTARDPIHRSEDILNKEPAISVIRTLIYYDVFDYPLSLQEILGNSVLAPAERLKLTQILDLLTDRGIVFNIDGYYSLTNDPSKVKARIKGNNKALRWMEKAKWFAGLISRFPYIRGVSVSGSLSKGFLGNDPDIDYFIITQPNRLWLARTFLVAFKKVFLLNSYKYFCINYFIDTESLEIEEQNLFTATEIVTMIPMSGNGLKDEFLNCNGWINKYYPNYSKTNNFTLQENKKGPGNSFLEFFLNNSLGDRLDSYFMKITTRHWKKKFGDKFPEEEFRLVFKSNKRISKHHPRNFQKKVLVEFEKRKARLENEMNINLENVVFQL